MNLDNFSLTIFYCQLYSFIFKRKGKITVEAFRNSNIAIDQKSSVIIRAAKRITALQSRLCLREQKSKNSFRFFLICSSSTCKYIANSFLDFLFISPLAFV